jgi:Spy/CpxP family protein refolding chaperone
MIGIKTQRLAAAAVLALVLAAGSVSAQQQRGRFGGGLNGLSLLRLPAPLATKLHLTDEQKGKLTALGEKLRSEIAEARQAANGDRQALVQKTREIAMRGNTEAAALLTADQKKDWDAWTAEQMKVQGLGRSATALLMVDGLTAEQKEKLVALAKEGQTKRRDLLSTLMGGGGQEAFQKIRVLDMESQTAVKGVLTADQVKQFEAGLAALPQGRRNQNQ